MNLKKLFSVRDAGVPVVIWWVGYGTFAGFLVWKIAHGFVIHKPQFLSIVTLLVVLLILITLVRRDLQRFNSIS